MTFKQWLESREQPVQGANSLLADLGRHKITEAAAFETLKALEARIDALSEEDTVKTDLRERVKTLWADYEATLYPEERPKKWHEKVFSRDTGLFLITISLIVLVYFALFWDHHFIGRLADAKVARGLITFLFALGTIGTALIITISVFTSNRPPTESKERFYRAKEILTILIGILGTIVGFYFGTPSDIQGNGEMPVLSKPMVSPAQALPDQPFSLISQAEGGTPPYVYTLSVETTGGEAVEKKTGHVKEKLLVAPLTLEAGEYKILLTLTDAEDKTCSIAKKISILKQSSE